MCPTTMDTFNLGCGGFPGTITLACTHISKQVKFKTSLRFYSKFTPSKTTILAPFATQAKSNSKKKRTGVVLNHNFKTKLLFKVTFIDALSN